MAIGADLKITESQGWLAEVRRTAYERFEKLGFPTREL